MPGYGTKLVTLEGDDKTHILAAGERTECGILIPMNSGAVWSYANRDDAEADCAACKRHVKVMEPDDDEPEPTKGKARSGVKA
jgi:hypothetical protein